MSSISRSVRTFRRGWPALLGLLLGHLSAACGDDGGATCAKPGGSVNGGADTHCGATVQQTTTSACHPPLADAGPSADASTAPEFGATLTRADGDDDDCKYHVTWSSTPVCENQDVTFTVYATKKFDTKPALGADPFIEAFLDPTHPAPNSNANFSDKGGGKYEIGPIRFDAPGRWTVRFHFYADCTDGPESPHGHAAFFVDVP